MDCNITPAARPSITLASTDNSNTVQQDMKRRPTNSLPSLQREHEIYSVLKTVEDYRSSFHNEGQDDRGNDGDGQDEDEHDVPSDEDSSSIESLPISPSLYQYTTLHFPTGELFSGHIHSSTGELVCGRCTSTQSMEVYEGSFRNGKRHGEGVCLKMDGSGKFLGRYKNGQMKEGTLIVTRGLSSDFTYTGSFVKEEFHGEGKIATMNGSVYQGMFERGLFHGVGTLRMVHDSDKSTSDNECSSKNSPKQESVYTGNFHSGLYHGSGTIVYPDLSSYAGTWHHGQKYQGTETYASGDVFEGSFNNGKRDGMGVLKCKRVTIWGVWRGMELSTEDGDVMVNYADGMEYVGEHVGCRPHGLGEMEYADFGSGSITYTGHFLNGFRHGEGRALFHNSNQEYEGEWVCDEPVGLKIFQHNGPLAGEGENKEENDLIEVYTVPMVDHEVSSSDRQCSRFGESESQGSAVASEGSGVATERLVVERGEENDRLQVSIVPVADPNLMDRPSKLVSSTNDSLSGSILTFASIEDTADSTTLSSTKRSKSPKPVFRKESRRSRRSFKSVDFEGCGLDASLKSLNLVDFGDKPPSIHEYANGDVFTGRLDANNFRQGSGIYTEHLLGSTYEGDWKDSMRHGVGLLTLSSGVEYCGEFFEDSIHGEGVITLIDDSVYTGGFQRGYFHGHGCLQDESNNRVYVGGFENGLRHGHGEETFSDGSRYVGQFQMGHRHGSGVLYDVSGKKLYEGEWANDLKQGKGHLFSHKHESYEGDFERGEFCGMGLYTYTDGTSIEGQWVDSVPRDGDWTINYPDGSKFYGFATFYPVEKNPSNISCVTGDCLRVPLPHGFGTLTYPSGQRNVGSFRYGEYQDT